MKGADERFGNHITEKQNAILMNCNSGNELCGVFLTVYDIVRYAREQKIFASRGSAANSTICYCLGITSVDPLNWTCFSNVLFLLPVMNHRILMLIEHERREEVIQYLS
jgi:error-prone DNA polymerase